MHELPEKSYILIAKDNTKQLLQYDSLNHQTQIHDLSMLLSNNFNGTSTCMIPGSSVILAGGCDDEFYPDAFCFNLKSHSLQKLCPMKHLRSRVTLFYYNNYVYAFGGECYQILKTAERYNLLHNRWEFLPDMSYERISPSCLTISNKIYILAGGSATIEVFDTTYLRFDTLSLNLNLSYGLAISKEDRIYILEYKSLKVYSQLFNLISAQTHTYDNLYSSHSNISVSGSNLTYYDDYLESIVVVDL